MAPRRGRSTAGHAQPLGTRTRISGMTQRQGRLADLFPLKGASCLSPAQGLASEGWLLATPWTRQAAQ